MSKIIGSTLYAPAGKVPTAYTAADNGKVLGVVDGKLAWVTKA